MVSATNTARLARRPVAATAARVVRAGMSPAGKVLLVCVLMLGASAFPGVRPKILGLLVHPVTAVATVLFVGGIGMLQRFPKTIALSLAAFTLVFTLAALIGPTGGVSFSVKVAASAVTIVVGAVYLRTYADFRAVVLAYALAVGLIAIRGLFVLGAEGVHGINPMEGIANKNGFSLFALPALMLASFIALKPDTPKMQRWILLGASLFIVFAVFSTGNRSGWIGVILVGLLLGVRAVRSFRTLVLLVMLAVTASALVMAYGDKLVIEDRLAKTDRQSSTLRVSLVAAAFEVGVENPLLGASPQFLPWAMSRLGGVRGIVYDTHNVTGLIVGGTGGLGTLAFVLLGWSMWRRPRGFARWATPSQKDAHYLLRAMLILWIVRGQFTAEILYSPSFSLALGLCVGLCVMTGVWRGPPQPTPPVAQRPRRAGAPA